MLQFFISMIHYTIFDVAKLCTHLIQSLLELYLFCCSITKNPQGVYYTGNLPLFGDW